VTAYFGQIPTWIIQTKPLYSGYFIPRLSWCIDNNGLGNILGDFFTNSSGHPAFDARWITYLFMLMTKSCVAACKGFFCLDLYFWRFETELCPFCAESGNSDMKCYFRLSLATFWSRFNRSTKQGIFSRRCAGWPDEFARKSPKM
jgi:hypothetical protein